MNDAKHQEFTLTDVWYALTRRRWLAIVVLVLCVAVGVGYRLVITSAYESYTVLVVGDLNTTPFETPAELAARLNAVYDVYQQPKIKYPYLTAAMVDANTVRLVARDTNPTGVVSYLDRIANEVVQRHAAIAASRRQLLVDERAALVQQIGVVRDLIKQQAEQPKEPTGDRNMLLTLGRQSLYDLVLELENKIGVVDQRLAPVNMRATTVIRKADVPATTVGLPTVAFLVVALLLGILLSVLIVVGLEIVGRLRAGGSVAAGQP